MTPIHITSVVKAKAATGIIAVTVCQSGRRSFWIAPSRSSPRKVGIVSRKGGSEVGDDGRLIGYRHGDGVGR